MLFICYPKCSTCQKAKKWLDEHNIKYAERHIVDANPTYDELSEWYGTSGLPLKKFFNTSGLIYKEMQLKDKLPTMSEEEQLQLLATNGMLVKRPLVVNGDTVLVGFMASVLGVYVYRAKKTDEFILALKRAEIEKSEGIKITPLENNNQEGINYTDGDNNY